MSVETPSMDSRSHLGYAFAAPPTDHDPSLSDHDISNNSHRLDRDGTDTQSEQDDDLEEAEDSLAHQSEAEVARRAAQILALDSRGRPLPLSPKQARMLDGVWTRSSPVIHHSSTSTLNSSEASGLDAIPKAESVRKPGWLEKLRESVLFEPPSGKAEEQVLVRQIQDNLRSMVNELGNDELSHQL